MKISYMGRIIGMPNWLYIIEMHVTLVIRFIISYLILVRCAVWHFFRWALHYNDVTMSLKSPTSARFAQSFIQAHIKENIKAPCHWHLWGEPPVTSEFLAKRTSKAENVSIWWRHHDVNATYVCPSVNPENMVIFFPLTQKNWQNNQIQTQQNKPVCRSYAISCTCSRYTIRIHICIHT